ncbi:hypothetical protein WDW89_11390 [Deltaproteobacteria bacterium TL4]
MSKKARNSHDFLNDDQNINQHSELSEENLTDQPLGESGAITSEMGWQALALEQNRVDSNSDESQNTERSPTHETEILPTPPVPETKGENQIQTEETSSIQVTTTLGDEQVTDSADKEAPLEVEALQAKEALCLEDRAEESVDAVEVNPQSLILSQAWLNQLRAYEDKHFKEIRTEEHHQLQELSIKELQFLDLQWQTEDRLLAEKRSKEDQLLREKREQEDQFLRQGREQLLKLFETRWATENQLVAERHELENQVIQLRRNEEDEGNQTGRAFQITSQSGDSDSEKAPASAHKNRLKRVYTIPESAFPGESHSEGLIHASLSKSIKDHHVSELTGPHSKADSPQDPPLLNSAPILHQKVVSENGTEMVADPLETFSGSQTTTSPFSNSKPEHKWKLQQPEHPQKLPLIINNLLDELILDLKAILMIYRSLGIIMAQIFEQHSAPLQRLSEKIQDLFGIDHLSTEEKKKHWQKEFEDRQRAMRERVEQRHHVLTPETKKNEGTAKQASDLRVFSRQRRIRNIKTIIKCFIFYGIALYIFKQPTAQSMSAFWGMIAEFGPQDFLIWFVVFIIAFIIVLL